MASCGLTRSTSLSNAVLCFHRCRSTSTRTMSVCASPRTGTLNSRDMHQNQLANMSSGSQVINASPPPLMLSSLASSSNQLHRGAVRPVLSFPPPGLPSHQSMSPSPRELSPMSLSLMSTSLVSPTVAVVAVDAQSASTDVHSHHTPSPAAGAAAFIELKLGRGVRNPMKCRISVF